jgi:hypothetical protein
MITNSAVPGASATPLPVRKRWEAPAIVLERALQVAAQDGAPFDPNAAPKGFMGPLSTSAGAGGNICT